MRNIHKKFSDLHVTVPADVHRKTKFELYKRQLSVQEVFTALSYMIATNNPTMMKILDQVHLDRLKQKVAQLRSKKNDMKEYVVNDSEKDDVYKMIMINVEQEKKRSVPEDLVEEKEEDEEIDEIF